jgi:hypothetical protein
MFYYITGISGTVACTCFEKAGRSAMGNSESLPSFPYLVIRNQSNARCIYNYNTGDVVVG